MIPEAHSKEIVAALHLLAIVNRNTTRRMMIMMVAVVIFSMVTALGSALTSYHVHRQAELMREIAHAEQARDVASAAPVLVVLPAPAAPTGTPSSGTETVPPGGSR